MKALSTWHAPTSRAQRVIAMHDPPAPAVPPPGNAVAVPPSGNALVAPPPENAVAMAERFFDLQLSFNLFPATYVHPSWIQHMGLADEEEGYPPATAVPFWT